MLAGYLAGRIMRGRGFGLLVNLLLGIVGGVSGGWVFGLFGLAATSPMESLITSVIGAALILWIASFFPRTPKTKSGSTASVLRYAGRRPKLRTLTKLLPTGIPTEAVEVTNTAIFGHATSRKNQKSNFSSFIEASF